VGDRQNGSRGRRVGELARHVRAGIQLQRSERCALCDLHRRRPSDDRQVLQHRQVRGRLVGDEERWGLAEPDADGSGIVTGRCRNLE
jgi:hypothetical protein